MVETCRSQIWACRTRAGFLIRVEGHGTMRESQAVYEFAAGSLGNEGVILTIDLNSCQFLDSTFLGCLIGLHKRWGHEEQGRFRIAASAERVKALLEPTRIHTLLRITDEADDVLGECVAVTPEVREPKDLGRHIMECHRQLADIEGPDQNVFRQIADRLENELNQ